MDYAHARPDLSWVPHPVHQPPPPSAYLRIVVVEATSARHPKPGSSRTALYIVPLLPPAPLQVGQYVHLHLLCSTTPDGGAPQNMDRAVAVPLPVAGRLEGERMQWGGEMEFVLKNEIAEAGVRRAFIRIRHVPDVSARAGLAGALEKKLQQLEVLRRSRDSGHVALAESATRLPRLQAGPRRCVTFGSESTIGGSVTVVGRTPLFLSHIVVRKTAIS
ncbi:hypothetical protein VTO73DRAFT_5768 [Trametes versicolor]